MFPILNSMSPEYSKLSGSYSQVLEGNLLHPDAIGGLRRAYSTPRPLTHRQTALVRSTCRSLFLIVTWQVSSSMTK